MCYAPKDILVPDTNLRIFPASQKFMKVPCGKCPDCRVSRSKEWAVRCLAEFHSLSDKEKDNCWFLTLTYSDEFNSGYLNARDMTLFWKKLRKFYSGCKIKYFYCGEFGTRTYRPHYHAIVYGLPVNDLSRINVSKLGDNLYSSYKLNEIWGKGYVVVGNLTLKSCSYVARYTLKKSGDFDCFQRVSQGFGKKYFYQNMTDIITNGYVSLGVGTSVMKASIPRYFLKLYRSVVGDKVYRKFLLDKIKKSENYKIVLKRHFLEKEKFGYVSRTYFGVDCRAVEINQACKKIIQQSLYELYQNRDF